MKLVATLLFASTSLLAQTATTSAPKASPHPTAAAHPAGVRPATCVKVPDLSPKIPALPAGLACPHALYTITTTPAMKLDYVSPLEPADLRDTLGLEPSTFSLAYVDTKIGSGPLAAPHKWYTIHYTGYLTDGTKFDSSVDRNEPIVIQIGERQVIPGWDTGFSGMRVGGKRRLYIPYQLAYGANGRPPIPPKAELVFDVEFVAQSDTEPKPTPKPEPTAPAAAPATPPDSTPKPQ